MLNRGIISFKNSATFTYSLLESTSVVLPKSIYSNSLNSRSSYSWTHSRIREYSKWTISVEIVVSSDPDCYLFDGINRMIFWEK